MSLADISDLGGHYHMNGDAVVVGPPATIRLTDSSFGTGSAFFTEPLPEVDGLQFTYSLIADTQPIFSSPAGHAFVMLDASEETIAALGTGFDGLSVTGLAGFGIAAFEVSGYGNPQGLFAFTSTHGGTTLTPYGATDAQGDDQGTHTYVVTIRKVGHYGHLLSLTKDGVAVITNTLVPFTVAPAGYLVGWTASAAIYGSGLHQLLSASAAPIMPNLIARAAAIR